MTETFRIRAYLDLRVTAEQVSAAPQITPQLRMIQKTMRANISMPYGPGADLLTSWPDYLASSDSDDAKKVRQRYYNLLPSLRKHVPVEAYCVSAGVPPIRILEIITGVCVRLGAQASTIIAAVNHPRVVQKTVEMALTDSGIEDRNTLHKATGFLPTPKSAQTNITVTANSAATASPQIAVVAPVPEQTIRRLADRFNESRALPAAGPPDKILDQPVTDTEIDLVALRAMRTIEEEEAEGDGE